MHQVQAALTALLRRISNRRISDGLTPASASPVAGDPEAALLAGGFFAVAVVLAGSLAVTHLLLIAVT